MFASFLSRYFSDTKNYVLGDTIATKHPEYVAHFSDLPIEEIYLVCKNLFSSIQQQHSLFNSRFPSFFYQLQRKKYPLTEEEQLLTAYQELKNLVHRMQGIKYFLEAASTLFSSCANVPQEAIEALMGEPGVGRLRLNHRHTYAQAHQAQMREWYQLSRHEMYDTSKSSLKNASELLWDRIQPPADVSWLASLYRRATRVLDPPSQNSPVLTEKMVSLVKERLQAALSYHSLKTQEAGEVLEKKDLSLFEQGGLEMSCAQRFNALRAALKELKSAPDKQRKQTLKQAISTLKEDFPSLVPPIDRQKLVNDYWGQLQDLKEDYERRQSHLAPAIEKLANLPIKELIGKVLDKRVDRELLPAMIELVGKRSEEEIDAAIQAVIDD